MTKRAPGLKIQQAYPVGHEFDLLGHKMRVIKHGYDDGKHFWNLGVVAVYFDVNGTLLTRNFKPSELAGLP